MLVKSRLPPMPQLTVGKKPAAITVTQRQLCNTYIEKIMIKLIPTLTLMMLFIFASMAQNIKGMVKDAEGKPVVNANISLTECKRFSVVNSRIRPISNTISPILKMAGTSVASGVGYKTAWSLPFNVAAADVTIPILRSQNRAVI